ncbi:hemerythrin domain-containing protein [Georgenia yuyongxinii]
MTTAPQTAGLTGAVQAHHSTLECELIRRTDALLATVGAREAHEPAQRDLVAFVRQEILPHVQAEQDLVYDTAPDAQTALLGQAMRVQHRQLAAFATEVERARTGMDAAMAASALVALFMARAEVENTVLLPALADAGTDLPALLGDRLEIVGGDQPAVARGDAGPTFGSGPATLDLSGLDHPACLRQLRATVSALEPGEECTILSGPELASLRYELEATLPQVYCWSLPAGASERSTTLVRRI